MSDKPFENIRRHAVSVTSSRVFARSRLAVTGMAMAAVLFIVSASAVSAATLTWKTTSGTWDLTSLNWDPGPVAWTQTGTTSASNDAVFGGTDGTYAVTLAGSQIAASNLTFNASGYTLSGTSLFLGSGTVTVASGSATIGSVIRGTNGITKNGAGSLTLSAVNAFTGMSTLNSGSLLLANNSALGTGTLTINGGMLAATSLSGTGGVNRTTSAGFIFNSDFTAGDVAGTNLAGNQLTINGAIILTGNRTINVVSGAGFNLSGTISDEGNGYGLIKTGGALMRLSGVGMYSGDTRVEEGTVSIFGNLGAQNSTLDTDGAGSFAFTSSAPNSTIGGLKGSKNPTINAGVVSISLNPALGVSNTYSGVISGTTSIIKINAGTQVFAGANTYTGATDIRAGTLQIGNSGTSGRLSLSSAITGSAGGRLAFNRTNAVTQGTDFNSVITGGLNVAQLGSGTLVLNGANTYTGTTAINAGKVSAGVADVAGISGALGNGGAITFGGGALQYTAASAGTDYSSRIRNSGRDISIDTNAQSVTYAGVIDSTNTNGLTLNDSNATKGRLTLSAANTFSGTTTVTSGTLRLSNSLALQNSILGTGGTGLVFDSAVSGRAFTVAGLSGSAALALTDSGANAIALSVGNADVSSSYSGALSGAGSLIKIGAGTFTVSGNNSQSGGTTISAGTLRMGSATALGASTGALVVNGGTLDMNGFSESVGTFSGSFGATVTSQSSAILTASSSATSEYAGLLSGAIAFTKQGSGLLVFSGSNSYGGGTWINAGTLRAGNASAFGTGSITLSSGATLDLNSFSIANTITNNGGTITGASSFTGTTQLTSGSTTLSNIGGTVDIDASAVAELSGTIDATVIVKNGGRGRAAGQIRKNVTVNAGAHFDILDGASIDEGASFTFANNGQIHVDRATNLTLSKAITGSGGLRKSNTGKLILMGSHDYSGNTLVEQGAFAVNGSLIGSGTVTINAGAILMGSGTINGPTIVEGIHSPGNSPGLETFTNGLTYGASSVLVWELSANTDSLADRGTLYDGIDLTGGQLNVTAGATVNLVFNAVLASGSASVVNWSDAFWDVSRTWKILEVGSSATWNAGTFSLGSIGSDVNGASLASVRSDASFSVSQDQDGSLYVNYVIVPEPGTVIFAGIGIAMLWAVSAARGRRRA